MYVHPEVPTCILLKPSYAPHTSRNLLSSLQGPPSVKPACSTPRINPGARTGQGATRKCQYKQVEKVEMGEECGVHDGGLTMTEFPSLPGPEPFSLEGGGGAKMLATTSSNRHQDV